MRKAPGGNPGSLKDPFQSLPAPAPMQSNSSASEASNSTIAGDSTGDCHGNQQVSRKAAQQLRVPVDTQPMPMSQQRIHTITRRHILDEGNFLEMLDLDIRAPSGFYIELQIRRYAPAQGSGTRRLIFLVLQATSLICGCPSIGSWNVDM